MNYELPTVEEAAAILEAFDLSMREAAYTTEELSSVKMTAHRVRLVDRKVVSNINGETIKQPSTAAIIQKGKDAGLAPESQLDIVFKQTHQTTIMSPFKTYHDVYYQIYKLEPLNFFTYQHSLQTTSPLEYIRLLKYFPVTGKNFYDRIASFVPVYTPIGEFGWGTLEKLTLPLQIEDNYTLFSQLLFYLEDRIKNYFDLYANRLLKIVRNNDSFVVASNILQHIQNALISSVTGAARSTIPLTLTDVNGTEITVCQLGIPEHIAIIAKDNKTYTPVTYITDYLVNLTKTRVDSALHTMAAHVDELWDKAADSPNPDKDKSIDPYIPRLPDLPFVSGLGRNILPTFSPGTKAPVTTKKKSMLVPALAGAALLWSMKG